MDATRDWRIEQVRRIQDTDTNPVAAVNVTRDVPDMTPRELWGRVLAVAAFVSCVIAVAAVVLAAAGLMGGWL